MTSEQLESLGTSVESERSLVLVAYVLHLIGSVTALPSIAALVLNYVKRRDTGSVLGSHHDWMIRTFWWAVLWSIIGFILTLVFIGWLVLGLVWLWYVYRHIFGMIRLANGEPMSP